MKAFFDPQIFTEKRGALMGFSILWIFMLHCGNIGLGWYDHIRKFGWFGVDIFFFLSAIGLCYSFQKKSDVVEFYKRRLTRIIPTWFVVLLGVHIIGLLCNIYLPALPFHVPHTLIQCFTWYTGLGYWVGEFVPNPDNYYYEWYVPALLVFYMVFPYLFKQKTMKLVVLVIAFTILSYLLTINHILYTWHFFYQRIPIFLLGIISYRVMMGDDKMRNIGVSCYCVMFIIGSILWFLLENFQINFVLTHIEQLMIPLFLIFVGRIIDLLRITTVLAFYGGISLELYLIHLYRRPQYLFSLIINNKPLCIFLSLILCTVVAFLLQKIMGNIIKKISVR